ncbi:MAG: hypothetical protein QXD77_01790 [Candidatus Aenigmatarchaeota archaeon]
MAAKMAGEQPEKISVAYLGTMSALYEEIKKMEKFYSESNKDAEKEGFYTDLLNGRKEVYDAAVRLNEAEPSKENSLRVKWAGAMCAMVAAGKAGCTGPVTEQALLKIMGFYFAMDGDTALNAIEAALYTGVIREEEGTYKLR